MIREQFKPLFLAITVISVLLCSFALILNVPEWLAADCGISAIIFGQGLLIGGKRLSFQFVPAGLALLTATLPLPVLSNRFLLATMIIYKLLSYSVLVQFWLTGRKAGVKDILDQALLGQSRKQ